MSDGFRVTHLWGHMCLGAQAPSPIGTLFESVEGATLSASVFDCVRAVSALAAPPMVSGMGIPTADTLKLSEAG